MHLQQDGSSPSRQQDVLTKLVSLELPGGPLEVSALVLQALVVCLDGHKLCRAGGIHLNLFCLNYVHQCCLREIVWVTRRTRMNTNMLNDYLCVFYLPDLCPTEYFILHISCIIYPACCVYHRPPTMKNISEVSLIISHPRIILDWSAITPHLPFAAPHYECCLDSSGISMRDLLPSSGKLNMPCPDLLSAATFIPPANNEALNPGENALFP